MMGRILAFIVLLVFAAVLGTCAHAEPLTIGLHVHSLHVPAKEDDSNQNYGLYVRTETGLTVGMYRSTIRRNAPYIGQTFSLYGPVDLTLGSSAVTSARTAKVGRVATSARWQPCPSPRLCK